MVAATEIEESLTVPIQAPTEIEESLIVAIHLYNVPIQVWSALSSSPASLGGWIFNPNLRIIVEMILRNSIVIAEPAA